MIKMKQAGIDWSKKDMYEGIRRPDLKPKENKMKKLKKELREKLANIEHQRWADWQRWCHKVLRENCPSPELEKVLERWDKQIVTKYKDLSEKEKDSDRKQVDRYWPLIEKALQEAREEGWQTGHKQTKEDYQAKEEEVRQKTLKEIYCMVIKNGSANRGWMLSKLTELYSKISGVNIPKTK